MGNYFNRNNDENENPDQLIEENNNEQINNLVAPDLKTIIKVKNPFYLLKETIHLEKDSIKNIYYIKFKYDSLIDFNCYINFNVKENSQSKNLKHKDEYELFFIPTDKFVEKNIVINNLPKGRNQEFFDENAFLDFEYFGQNTTRRKEEDEYEEEEEEEDDDIDNENINSNNNQTNEDKANKDKQNEENESLININKENNNNNVINENVNNNIGVNENENNNNEINDIEYEDIYDIGIEFVPYYEKDSNEFDLNKENNEIALISLFNIEKKENNELEIKCVLQKLKKHNYLFELKDIYDGAGNNGKCVICYTNNRNTIFLPCRHSCCCQNCSGTLMPKICPLCKENIKDIICLYKDLDRNNTIDNDNDNNEANLNENEENDKTNNDNGPIQSINES